MGEQREEGGRRRLTWCGLVAPNWNEMAELQKEIHSPSDGRPLTPFCSSDNPLAFLYLFRICLSFSFSLFLSVCLSVRSSSHFPRDGRFVPRNDFASRAEIFVPSSVAMQRPTALFLLSLPPRPLFSSVARVDRRGNISSFEGF